MSNNRTTKRSYPSRYSPNGWVTAAQYIVELICEAKARHDDKTLPIKFWTLKDWRNFFVWQSKIANQLIKKFDAESIIAAIKDKRSYNTYSLNAPWLHKIIQEKFDQPKPIVKPPEPKPTETLPDTIRKPINASKSIIGKLE